MTIAASFISSLAVTLVVLGVTVWSGVRARLRIHLPAVATAVMCLAATIYFAERLGEEYDLSTAGPIKAVHLALAKIATISYLLPLASGVMTLRNRRHRTLHLMLAMLTLLLTVLAAATGTLMVMRAEPLP